MLKRDNKRIQQMAIIISHTMTNSQFENKDSLKQIAKNILNRQTNSQETISNIINKSVFNNKLEQDSQIKLLNTQAYIAMNTSLKETLKYVKNNSVKKQKKTFILGELKERLDLNQEYSGELLNFEIDSSIKNIFAA